jgi:hypothetical protein
MPQAKHVRICNESFGDNFGEKTVKLSGHIAQDGSASWICFTVDREQMLRLAVELNVFALNDANWSTDS